MKRGIIMSSNHRLTTNERTEMITKEQEILNYHAARMEFREKLNNLVMDVWERVDMDDIAAELSRLHAQTVTFIGHHAWEKAKKMQEEDKKRDNIS